MMTQASDSLAADVSAKVVDWPTVDSQDTTGIESQYKVIPRALTYKGRIYVAAVDSLYGKVISLLNDSPEAGYFGALEDTELVSTDIEWPAMDSHVCKYLRD
jgi:hypothetical protein